MDLSELKKSEFNPNIFYSGYILRKKILKAINKYAHLLDGKMMDFGCGSKPYEKLFSVEKYIGVDYNGEGHPHINEKIDVFYDGKTLPFEDNYFDSVFSSEVFEHVFNLEEILIEIKRVMKPGAKILVTCPFAIPEHEVPNDYGRYSSFGLKHLFEKNGFRVLNYEKIGDNFETLMQLKIAYYEQVLLLKLNRIKPVKIVLEYFIYAYFNLYTLLFAKLLPSKQTLFLNNIIVCEKL